MAKAKLKSIFVKLMSEAGTGFFYVTRKNPKTVPERMILRKVCSASHSPLMTPTEYPLHRAE